MVKDTHKYKMITKFIKSTHALIIILLELAAKKGRCLYNMGKEYRSIDSMYISSEKSYNGASDLIATIETSISQKKTNFSILDGLSYMFIKDFQIGEEIPQNNTKDMIIIKGKEIKSIVSGANLICSDSGYSINNRAGSGQKQFTFGRKNILVNIHKMQNWQIFLTQLKIAEDYSKDPKKIELLKKAFSYMTSLINTLVRQWFFSKSIFNKNWVSIITEQGLKEIGLENSLAYKLIKNAAPFSYGVSLEQIIHHIKIKQFYTIQIYQKRKIPNIDELDLSKEKKKFEQEKNDLLRATINSMKIDIRVGLELRMKNLEESMQRLIFILVKKEVNLEHTTMEEVAKITYPWNNDLLEIIYKTIEYIQNYKETSYMDKLKKRRDTNRKIKETYLDIIYFLKNTREGIFYECIEDNMVGNIYSELVDEFMKNTWVHPDSKSSDSKKIKNSILEENRKIVELILTKTMKHIFPYPLPAKTEIIEKKKNEVISMLEGIEFSKEIYSNIELLKKRVDEKIKKITNTIFFMNLKRNNPDNVNIFNFLIHEFIDHIVNFLVVRQISCWEQIDLSAFQDKVAEEESFLSSFKTKDVFEFILDLVERFYYERKEYFTIVYPLKKTISYDPFLSSIIESLQTTRPAKCLPKNIFSDKIEYVYKLSHILYSLKKQIDSIKSKNAEIWKTPAILIFQNSENSKDKSKKIATIRLYIKKEELYEKTIEFTDRNLQAFKDAKTLNEIKRIPSI